ncbi:restriction endonuclease subunit S [Carboxylicivirga taeanensis]|uniref:restriction endonuclease subunit S n=1 Tax=Carboxylicivirga taeanensis TaxID=1416875 RepID=UPI003F6DE766
MENNVPKLRFPEFEGSLNSKKLGSIATFSKGKGISKSDINENGVVECIRYGELYTVYSEVINEVVSKTNVDVNELVLSESNDVIIPASGETQIDIATASCVLKEGVALGGDLNIIKSPINGVFLSYYLNNTKRTEIASLAQGNSVVHLYGNQLKTLKLNIPSPNEQTKIANFLTSVDKRITLLQKKKAELERYKKGIMQKLFSQTIRFKDDNGNDFPEWEEKKFGSIYSFKTTNSFSRDKLNYESGRVKNVHYGDIHTRFDSHFDVTKEKVPFVNNEENIDRIAADCYLKEGDLIIADASEDYADIGKAIEVVNLNSEKVLAGLHTFLARQKNNNIYIGFAGHLMKVFRVRLAIMRIAQGTKVLGISTKRLAEIEMEIPSKPEQKKIANFLYSIDKSIEKVGHQIDETVTFKKGLLQKMFV